MDTPVNVYLKLPVTEISKIDDQRSQISLRLTYKLLWPEPRMVLNTSADWSEGEINVRGDMVDNFWTPDIIIHDLVSFYKPEVLNQVAALEVKRNKRLYYKVRSDLTTVCKGMKFSRFPLDEHVCYLKLTSFGYNDREMLLDGQFSYDNANQRALPFNVHISEINGADRVFTGANSNYSVYGLEIHLSRCVSPYLLNVYLPTAIFVVMSWVSFLIPTDVVPARIVLLVTLCLVIINTFNNVTVRIPVASQVTALEIWLLACILLVFGALAEYAFILRQVIKLSRKTNAEEEQRLGIPCDSPSIPCDNRLKVTNGQSLSRLQSPTRMVQSSGGIAFKLNNGMDANAAMADVARTTSGEDVIHMHHIHSSHQMCLDHAGAAAAAAGTNGNGANGGGGGECHSRSLPLRPTHHHIGTSTSEDPVEYHAVCSPTGEIMTASSPTRIFGGDNLRPKGQNKQMPEHLMKRYQENVDGSALIIFPTAFLLFNIAYWGHYLTKWSPSDLWETAVA